MNFQRGRRHEDLEVNLVPLIDVLLVIIIFLVVSATFSRITVGVDTGGRYVVNDTDVVERSVEAISQALRQAAGTAKEPTIVINADANATHQSVVNVMEAARQAGYTHITFATQIKAGS